MRERIVLKTISPVHIGGKTQALTPLEQMVFNGRCYVVGEAKLGRAMLDKNKLDELSLEIGRQGRRFNLEEFLRSRQLLNERFLRQSSDYHCNTRLSRTPLRMRPFMRDVFGCPFIPGSSIKGAIRTAVLYNLLKRMQAESPRDFQQYFVNSIEQKLREFNNTDDRLRSKPWFKDKVKSSMANKIETELLQHFDLPVPGGYAKRGATGQQKDYMRVLKVSDTTPMDKDALPLVEVQVLSLTGERDIYLKTPIYVEIILPGAELQFSVTLDENIMRDFSQQTKGILPFNTLEELFNLVHSFAHDIWRFEREYWAAVSGPGAMEMRNFYDQKAAGMRMGWGAGLSGTSLLMLLPPELRRSVRDALFEPRGQFVFPKSRRAVMDGDVPRWPLGWTDLYIN